MIVRTSFVDVAAPPDTMRLHVAEPVASGGRYPAIVLFSDIFALTPSMLRAAVRFAAYGFIVVAPEFYHRTEPAGTAFAFEDRERAFAAAQATRTPDFDADIRTALDAAAGYPRVRPGAIGATGFCLGGHLAVRAALQPDVRAAVAFYPTGLHEDALGGSADADTLERVRAGGVAGRIGLAFGGSDPHVPRAAIATIHTAFAAGGTDYLLGMYDGEHAFMRDEGPRWNPSEADRAYADAIGFFHAALDPLG